MKRRITLSIALALSIVLVSLTSSDASAALDQPFMKAARNDLNKALSSLRKADNNKGGHRARAMNLASQAVGEVNKGIAYDRANPGNRRRNSDFDEEDLTSNSADQPNMQKAKERLQDALDNLQRATADKGGHRQRAMDLVREAIGEVNKGIAFDHRN